MKEIEKVKNFLNSDNFFENIKFFGEFSNFYPDKIFLCGLGGSALAMDLVKDCNFFDLNIPVFVIRDDKLPNGASENSLLILVSYSGETIEILKIAEQAKNKKLKTIIVSGSGRLSDWALKNEIFLCRSDFDSEISSRYMVFQLMFAIIILLEKIGLNAISPIDFLESLKRAKINSLSDYSDFKDFFKDGIFCFYSDFDFRSLPYFWKVNFNESLKIPAFANVFPEAFHNEIEGNLGKFDFSCVFFAENRKDNNKTEFFMNESEFLKKLIIILKGIDFLEKILYGVYLSLRICLDLSGDKNLNPFVNSKIENFKKSFN